MNLPVPAAGVCQNPASEIGSPCQDHPALSDEILATDLFDESTDEVKGSLVLSSPPYCHEHHDIIAIDTVVTVMAITIMTVLTLLMIAAAMLLLMMMLRVSAVTSLVTSHSVMTPQGFMTRGFRSSSRGSRCRFELTVRDPKAQAVKTTTSTLCT